MIKKFLFGGFVLALAVTILPKSALAAGVYISGGSLKYPGDTSSVSITASGATFNGFQGTISSSGSIQVTSCSPNDALWVSRPTGKGAFAGALTSQVTSFRIATCYIKANSTGNGSIAISGVQLTNASGSYVGSDGDSSSFNIARRPTPPGSITVTSTSHPDQNTAYEATTIDLSWDKPSGVTGFSYLFDQAEATVPSASVVGTNTTASYADQAVGTYYFHIRALNGDGWGDATHFKITIKEPDPKINENLGKPSSITIERSPNFQNNIADGTVSGIVIRGTTLPNYFANIKLDPLPTLPEGRLWSVKSDANGNFEYLIDFPIAPGLYKLTVQGQDNKILTPISDEIRFEISQSKGGAINILTADDTLPPVIPALKWYQKWDNKLGPKVNASIYIFTAVLVLSAIAGTTIFVIKHRSLKKIINSIKSNV